MAHIGEDFGKELQKWETKVWSALDSAEGFAEECDLDNVLEYLMVAEWIRTAERPRAETTEELRELALAVDRILDMVHRKRARIVNILKEKCGCGKRR